VTLAAGCRTGPFGTRLGPYEILSPIGAGGIGEVYRARDTRLGRDVAIKVLPEGLAGDPTALDRPVRRRRPATVCAIFMVIWLTI
jgi:serine/threonine protein kinase